MRSRLLLVNANPTMRRVVELTFAADDVEITAVEDVDRALAALTQSAPDIVLADVGPPGADGSRLLTHIRHTPALAHIPVLLLAGAFDHMDRARAQAAGASGFLVKPFDPPALVARVRELLSSPASGPVADVATDQARSDQAVVAATPAAAPTASPDLDRYFQELDAAFAALPTSPRPSQPAQDDTVAAGADAPAERTDDARSAVAEAAASPSSPAAALALSDAFAALLSAEQSGAPAPSAAVRVVAAGSAPVIDVERLAEQVARRVLDRLADGVVRDVVGELVGDAAERLVREEIERIKRNIT